MKPSLKTMSNEKEPILEGNMQSKEEKIPDPLAAQLLEQNGVC